MTDLQVDVAILGAGSGGENLASQLARRGHRVAVVEERLVGGECPYFACMPSKSMLHDAVAGVPFGQAARRRDEVAEHFDDRGHARHLVDDLGVELLRGRGRFDGPGKVTVALTDGGTATVTAPHLVLATGAYEPALPADGVDEVEIWSSEDAWTSHDLPARLLVVGGGAVGTEVAAAYAIFGSNVVLVQRSGRLLRSEDPEAAERVADDLRGHGVEVCTDTEVREVTRTASGAIAATLTDGRVLEVDRIAACLGKRPRVHDIGLESLGVDPDDFTVGTDGRVEGADGLWSIGDVSGHPAFTHTANAQADCIAHNLDEPTAEPWHLDLAALPRCVFVEPALGAVGSTDPGDDRVRVTIDLANIARGHGDGASGLAVLAATRNDRRIVGFSGVGPGMEEAVSVAGLAIRQRMTVDDLARLVAPFPTYSEVVPVLAMKARDELDG